MPVTNNPVVRAAARHAEVIHSVKVTLVVLNLVGSALLVLAGVLVRPGPGTPASFGPDNTYTPATTSGTELWWLLSTAGCVSAVVNTLLIIVVMGWFEHMLRASAENARLLYNASSESRLEY